YRDFAARRENAAALLAELEAVFATGTSEHWLGLLRSAGVPCGPVNTVAQALRDPHTVARGMVVETEHPYFGTVRQVASPLRVGSEKRPHMRAPRRDEDAGYVLGEVLGYDAERIERLRAADRRG
ncbi:CoA transferase, partial [Microbispora rosea]